MVPCYNAKDFCDFIIFGILLSTLVFYNASVLRYPQNFISANSLVTPVYIMPGWYFLFAFAVLQAVANKLGGVIIWVLNVLILVLLSYFHASKLKSLTFRLLEKLFIDFSWWVLLN